MDQTVQAMDSREEEHIVGVCRIGRTGNKWHRAIYIKRGKRGFIQCVCGCPGTSNNHASQHSFTTTIEPTCQR